MTHTNNWEKITPTSPELQEATKMMEAIKELSEDVTLENYEFKQHQKTKRKKIKIEIEASWFQIERLKDFEIKAVTFNNEHRNYRNIRLSDDNYIIEVKVNLEGDESLKN